MAHELFNYSLISIKGAFWSAEKYSLNREQYLKLCIIKSVSKGKSLKSRSDCKEF